MGWTSYHVNDTSSKGRLREIDDMFSQKFVIVKSAMVGSTYYGALKSRSGIITGVVVLTKVDSKDYYNFAYKVMHEDCGPHFYKCPISILNFLTETTSDWALGWRRKCREYHTQSKNTEDLSSLPVGSVIELNDGVILVKREPAYQFKRPWFQVVGENKYYSKPDIEKLGWRKKEAQ